MRGYRMLRLNEISKVGDEWSDKHIYWQPVLGLAGESMRSWRNELGGCPSFKFRRPLKLREQSQQKTTAKVSRKAKLQKR